MILQLLTALTFFEAAFSAFVSQRPAAEDRTYQSEVVDQFVLDMVSMLKDDQIAWLFNNCYPNTLDTTIYSYDDNDTFVITGDIEAMWLRDSANQMNPYLSFINSDKSLRQLIGNVIKRQAKSILIDPYANAFNFNSSGAGHQDDIRKPPMTNAVFEGKYELDSLVAFLRLSNSYLVSLDSTSDDYSSVLSFVYDDDWLSAVKVVLETITHQQSSTASEHPNAYYLFERETYVATDTLEQSGWGVPASGGIGLSKSYFRPSDDAVTFPYHIPSNAVACIELNFLGLTALPLLAPINSNLAIQAISLSQSIYNGLSAHAAFIRDGKNYLSYEIDGFGSYYFMDDANMPSLLSLPLYGFQLDQYPTIVHDTRLAVLDGRYNPFFFSGRAGSGVGGPHEGYGMVWPMAIIVQAMTSSDDDEIMACLDMLKNSDAGTGFMHESFWMDDDAKYTRSWFAWANGMFGELIVQLANERPWLVLKEADSINTLKSIPETIWSKRLRFTGL